MSWSLVNDVTHGAMPSMLILPDGSHPYMGPFNLNDVNKNAELSAQPPVYSLENFTRLDKDIQVKFERLLEVLGDQHDVVLFLPPYHPITYKKIEPKYRMLGQAERYVRSTAAAKGVLVVGSYDPDRVGCAEHDFSDGMHPLADCVQKILLPMLASKREFRH